LEKLNFITLAPTGKMFLASPGKSTIVPRKKTSYAYIHRPVVSWCRPVVPNRGPWTPRGLQKNFWGSM